MPKDTSDWLTNYPKETEVMADPVKPATPPVAPPAPPAAPAPDTPPMPNNEDPLDKLSPDELKALLKTTRSEAAERRREASDLKNQLKIKEDKEAEQRAKDLEEQGKFRELAEQNRLRADQIQTAARNRIRTERLRAAASAAGIIDLDLVSNIPVDGVSVNDDFEVLGVDEAVAKYKQTKPMLFKRGDEPPEIRPTSPETPVPNPPPPAAGPPGTPPGSVRQMSKEEYAKAKAEALKDARKELGGQGHVRA